jgi:hypothetical protein
MATPVDNIVIPCLCVRPPEYKFEESSLEARRMLAKFGELHQPVLPRPVNNPGVAWGSTCLDRPCEHMPNMVLEVAVLHRERLKAELVPFGILWEHPSKRRDSTRNLLGLEYRWLCGSHDLASGGGSQRCPEARRKLATRFNSVGCAAFTM